MVETGSGTPLLSSDDFPGNVSEVDNGDQRFGSRKPWVTVLLLMIGPILFNLTGSFQDSIDFWLISLVYGETGLGIIGFATTFRYLLNGMASFPGQACTIKVSSLLGQGKRDIAAQVVVDLYRIGFVLSIIVPIAVRFSAYPMMRFMECPPKWIPACVDYAVPVCSLMFLSSIFRISAGLLLGEGRSILHAMIHMVVLVLNCAVFDPILLVGFRLPLWTVALTYCFALGIPGLILFVLICNGKFTVKPTWRMFLKPFSGETWNAITLSFSNLLTFLTGAFPSMVFYRYLYKACDNSGNTQMNSVMPATLKVYNFIGEITLGIAAGCLAAGSWAFSKRLFHRLLRLAASAAGVGLIQELIMVPFMLFKPSIVMQIWLKNQGLKDLCDKFMPVIFYANPLLALHETGTDILLATKQPYLALVPMLCRGIMFGVGSYVYYLGGKYNPENVLFVFPSIDILQFLSVCALLPATLKRLWVTGDRGRE